MAYSDGLEKITASLLHKAELSPVYELYHRKWSWQEFVERRGRSDEGNIRVERKAEERQRRGRYAGEKADMEGSWGGAARVQSGKTKNFFVDLRKSDQIIMARLVGMAESMLGRLCRTRTGLHCELAVDGYFAGSTLQPLDCGIHCRRR
jgi:hypothetical protein